MWATFLKLLITVISRFDGKPGLSLEDFRVIVKTVASIDLDKGLTGEQKEAHVRQFIAVRYTSNVVRYLVSFISSSAYVYARNNGLLDRPPPLAISPGTELPYTGDNVLFNVPPELRDL